MDTSALQTRGLVTTVSCSSSDLSKLSSHFTHVTHILNEAKRKIFRDFVEDNSSDQERLFRAARMLLGKNDSSLSFPDFDDKSLLVNDIAQSFVRKIIRIRDNHT